MKATYLSILFIISSCSIEFGKSFLLEGAVIGAASLGYAFRCKFYECCNDEYVPLKTYLLTSVLKTKLYGQDIARSIVDSAISSHVHHSNPRKPLVLSFHGLPGSGKNYVVSMIAESLFKLGEKSKHYHFFNGRSDFPNDRDIGLYKYNLKQKVSQALSSCERSLFVFDEVDKMPAGVLDVLVPFLDYTNWSSSNNKKAIFIFLSNTGSDLIVNRMIELWDQGKRREETTIQDFEPLIQIGAFNEKGGLYKSGTIESKLIDHHVPFLPMEERHVKQCLRDVFKHWGIYSPSNDLMEEAMKHVTFGPSPHNLYSTAGCKRLDHKVSSIIYKPDFGD